MKNKIFRRNYAMYAKIMAVSMRFGHSGAQGWAPECPKVKN